MPAKNRTKLIIGVLIVIIAFELFGLSLFHTVSFQLNTADLGPPPQGETVQSSLVTVAKWDFVYASVHINIVPSGPVRLQFPNGTLINLTGSDNLNFVMPSSGGIPLAGTLGAAGFYLDQSQPIAASVSPGLTYSNYDNYYGNLDLSGVDIYSFFVLGNATVTINIYGASL